MLDFIKSQINPKQGENKAIEPNDVPDEAVLEYASLYQELDDLSEKGTDENKARKMSLALDIPLALEETDIEPTTIEFDIESGTLTDVNNDKTAVVESSYEGMKTYDQFYKEAVNVIQRFARESDASYDARVSEYANEMYTEYCNDATQYGYYGFNSVSLDDERVPSKMTVDFGPITQESDTSFISKVKVFFSTDEDHCITKKQLDSVARVKAGAFKGIAPAIMAYMESTYTVPEKATLWDICTPKNLIVPKGNGDSFCVVLEFTNELTGESEYYGWTQPVIEDASDITMESCVEINKNAFVSESRYENKDNYMKFLEEEMKKPDPIITKRPISRFVQETIDFGTGGDTAATDAGASTDDTAGTTTVTGDQPAGDSTANADGNVDTGNSSDAPESNDTDTNGENKEIVDTNNVSSEIADKVAEKQQENMNPDTGAIEGETITFDDGTSTTGDAGVSGTEDTSVSIDEETPAVEEPTESTDNEMSVDDQLADLDTTPDESSEDTENPIPGVDDDGNIDLDNMTIDQLIEQGSEKLKSMPLGEIKNFLQSDSPEVEMESFIITANNVNDNVAANIRKCLGVLNDNKERAEKIFVRFAGCGRKLNRVLTKASKMTKIYSAEEIESIKKLNRSLIDLLMVLKKNRRNADASTIKSSIKTFTDNSKKVSAFVEKKITGKPVQESYVVQEGLFLSAGNAKKRLGKRIPLVYADMAGLIKANEGGYLTKGKISKMYKPKTGSRATTYGADSDWMRSTSSKEVEINTPASNHIADLTKIAGKILRKDKVQSAFTRDELSIISDLVDNLDDFVDIVEAIIYDNNADVTSIIDKLVELAKKIVANLDEIQGNTPVDDETASVEDELVETSTDDAEEELPSTEDESNLDTDDDESNTPDDTPTEDGGDDAEADTDEEADTDSDVDVEDEEEKDKEDEE